MMLAASSTGLALPFRAQAGKQKFPDKSLFVNVNTATIDELVSLPEIGSELAKEIFAYRTYEQVEDLLRVPGIGRHKLAAIRPYVRVAGKTEPYVPEK